MGQVEKDKNSKLQKDNREFLLSRRQFLLSTVAAMGLASMTPIVSIARAASPEESRGLVISTTIEDVRTIDRKAHKVVYVSSVTKIAKKSGETKLIKNNTYIIRGLSGKVFEPLISITYADKTTVFAYADDDEFIAEDVSGWNDLLVIREALSRAKSKGLRKLERLATLIMRAAVESEITP